jgi:hypothetical protein
MLIDASTMQEILNVNVSSILDVSDVDVNINVDHIHHVDHPSVLENSSYLLRGLYFIDYKFLTMITLNKLLSNDALLRAGLMFEI